MSDFAFMVLVVVVIAATLLCNWIDKEIEK